MRLTIRPIDRTGARAAYALLQDVARWLEDRGRRQRIAATSFETYLQWQSADANWGVFDGGRLAAIFTLIREPLRDWPDVPVEGEVPWLRALAVDPERRGDGVGGWAIDEMLKLVETTDVVYLDCVSDFLPGYYASHGFEFVARQVRGYPDGEYDITLMRQPGRKTAPDP